VVRSDDEERWPTDIWPPCLSLRAWAAQHVPARNCGRGCHVQRPDGAGLRGYYEDLAGARESSGRKPAPLIADGQSCVFSQWPSAVDPACVIGVLNRDQPPVDLLW